MGRLERNLKKLLVSFARDLLEESTSAKKQQVARFLKSRARQSASLICNEIDSKPGKERLEQKVFDEPDDSDLDMDAAIDPGADDDSLEYLDSLQAFITNSRAFSKFRKNVEKFVRPSRLEAENNPEESQRLFSVLPFLDSEDDIRFQQPSGFPARIGPLKIYTSLLAGLRSADILNSITRQWNFLTKAPPLEKGKKRVTWSCACGTTLCDDYEEVEKGSAKRLQKHLRRENQQKRLSRSTFRRLRDYQFFASVYDGLILFSYFMATTYQGITKKFVKKTPDLPSYEIQAQQQPSQSPLPFSPPPEQLFLLLCIANGKVASPPTAYQPAIHDVDTDKKFFQTLRGHYSCTRSRWWSWMSLWELQHIYFVYFHLYTNSLVDIKQVNDVPPDKVSAAYRYERVKLNPPIGSNLLMHYYRCPEHASGVTPCFRKVPKKVGTELTVCPIAGESPGWGLLLEEAWNWKKILTILCFLFILASMLEGILYWRFEHSVQDAMALGTFLLACFSIVVATLQAWLMIA